MAGFRVTAGELELTGPWSPAARRTLRLLRLGGLDLTYTNGWAGSDLDFLSELAGGPVRTLSVIDPGLRDVSGIEHLGPQLEVLHVRTRSKQALDLNGFPRLRAYQGPWAHVRDSIGAATQLQVLMVEGYDAPDLAPLAELPALRGVRLERPTRLTSLDGMSGAWDRFCALQARRLADVSGLAAGERLQLLELTGCRPTTGLDLVPGCVDLVELDLSGCGEIPSVAGWRALTRLRRATLLGSTVIADGDLTPLVDLPELAWVSMQPRRHYRPPAAELFAVGRSKTPYRRPDWWA